MSANPIADPELWATATIAGRDTPGVCTVTGIDREAKLDEKDGPGASGAITTFRGTKLMEPVLKLRLFEEEHYDAYMELLAYLTPLQAKGTAVDFWHGSAEALSIRSVSIVSLGTPVNTKEGDALFEATIKLKEWRPAPKANATNTAGGAKAGQGKGVTTQPTALTEREREAQRLLDEARRIQ